MHKLLKYLVPVMLLAAGCSPKQEIPVDPLPAIDYHVAQTAPFMPAGSWKSAPKDWSVVNEALRFTIDMPVALETKLSRNDREIWKAMLQDMEQSQADRRAALPLSNLQISPPVECMPPSSAFSLQQRAQIQQTLQQHRNVLWRMGRLEMASRGVQNAMRQFVNTYAGGSIKNADVHILAPVAAMQEQMKDMRAAHPVPKGDWKPGDFHDRAARTTHPEMIFAQSRIAFESWQERMETSERWQYLAHSATPVLEAMQIWRDEFEELVRAWRSLASAAQTLERDFAPPHALVAWPCINKNLKQIRIVSDLYSHILPMQWSMTKAKDKAFQTISRLQSQDYVGVNHAYLESLILDFIDQLETQKVKLAQSEDLLLAAWDEMNNVFWKSLPEFVDPIHNSSHPAVENAETWNIFYQEIKAELNALPAQPEPEPEQPVKRGKPLPPYISTILDTLHAPSRIDEGEKGLLAISELEAHMVSIRDELLRLCKQGACTSFPEAEIANSPRKSPWIVTWRQTPPNERTLGHTLIVIKLSKLHLSRLVQRLTEIYAWFSETSNADLSWKKLKSWQRIWTLYAEPNGTYASFLKSIAVLDQHISDMELPQKKYAESETLHMLLSIQNRFFDLTLDYARFIDAKKQPPVSFDELLETWELLDKKLTDIEKATIERDLALHPEWNKEKRKVVDIPR